MVPKEPPQSAPFSEASERMPAILIVEDEALLRIALSDYLQDCGFKTFEASKADDAILMLEEDVAEIDLVFSDVQTPGTTDGFGLARWVHENRPQIPILLASGYAKKAAQAKIVCDDEHFMSKPYELDQVVARLRGMLADTRTH